MKLFPFYRYLFMVNQIGQNWQDIMIDTNALYEELNVDGEISASDRNLLIQNVLQNATMNFAFVEAAALVDVIISSKAPKSLAEIDKIGQSADDTAKTAGTIDNVDDISKIGKSGEAVQYGQDIGKMGKYVENPGIKVDWSKYAEHGTERMAQRGMSKEMIDSIVENGKVLSQSGGNKYAYISQEGVVVVSKNGKLITAWGKTDFDEKMIEIVEKLYAR